MERIVKYPTEKLKSKFRSKLDLYKVITQQMHYLVPAYRRCPVKYMKDLLAGRKRALKQYKLSSMSVPDYPELSVKNMYSTLKNDETVSQFIPDYGDKLLPDKEFFHKLICTLYPAEMYDIISQAHKNRGVEQADNDGELVEICEAIAKEIEDVVLLPTKPGRTIHLLKKKAKVAKKRNPPKKHVVNFQSIIDAESAFNIETIHAHGENNAQTTNMTEAQDMNIDKSNKEEEKEF